MRDDAEHHQSHRTDVVALVARSCPSCRSIGPRRDGCVDVWHITCDYNGGKREGAERWDPRYDCGVTATWHVLLAPDSRVTMHGQLAVASCDEHLAEIINSTTMRHSLAQVCADPRSLWSLVTNRCVVTK
jgi:hypothetical protein